MRLCDVCCGSLLAASCLLNPHLVLQRAQSQEAELPPPPKRTGVRITFLPPPMQGTLSLGIYDKPGKLVRVLAREATEKDFIVGLNGLITFWDGRDDAGHPLPAGTYYARGFSVGAIEVEGVAYHCNDWMLDDASPRLRRVLSVQLEKSHLSVWAEGADGKPQLVHCDQAGQFAGEIPPDPQISKEPLAAPALAFVAVEENRVVIHKGSDMHPLNLPELTKPIDASLGHDDVWVIDQAADHVEVKDYSLEGEFRRRLSIDPTEPAPRRVFASRTSDLIFLIEEKPGIQRVRGLALDTAPADAANPANPAKDGDPATSTWKTVLTKTILASDDFAAVAGHLGRILPFIPRDKFTVHLLPNELLQNVFTTVNVTIDFNAGGSFLKTLDGLPLRRITEAPNVKWTVIGQEGSGKQLTIFQGDGAVVEEFMAHKLANMMAFDAGDYDWKPDTK